MCMYTGSRAGGGESFSQAGHRKCPYQNQNCSDPGSPEPGWGLWGRVFRCAEGLQLRASHCGPSHSATLGRDHLFGDGVPAHSGCPIARSLVLVACLLPLFMCPPFLPEFLVTMSAPQVWEVSIAKKTRKTWPEMVNSTNKMVEKAEN